MKRKDLIDALRENKSSHELLNALRLLADGDWDKSHAIAQKREGTADYDRLHALLHRIEGDTFNARYWYNRIGQPFPAASTDDEWNQLAEAFLKKLS